MIAIQPVLVNGLIDYGPASSGGFYSGAAGTVGGPVVAEDSARRSRADWAGAGSAFVPVDVDQPILRFLPPPIVPAGPNIAPPAPSPASPATSPARAATATCDDCGPSPAPGGISPAVASPGSVAPAPSLAAGPPRDYRAAFMALPTWRKVLLILAPFLVAFILWLLFHQGGDE